MNKAMMAAVLTIAAAPAFAGAKNVIFFIGDGAGVSSLNAASIYGYSRPQALYLQSMPHVALADTSTSKEWVTDAAAAATAWATGRKGWNGAFSQTTDGASLKTVLEFAEEHGLSTGIISNDDRTGVTIAAVSAFYAHTNNRQLSGDIFQQMLNPKYGNGPEIVIGTGRKWIVDQTVKMGRDLASDIRAKGYQYLDSLDAVQKLDPAKDRVIALFDEPDFDFNAAVEQAVARLSRNPKGYVLIAFSDCHLPKTVKTLTRVVELDKAVRNATEKHRQDTLILATADHGYDLRIKGEKLVETQRAATPAQVAAAISLEEQHTAEEVPVIADGPGSEAVHGFMSNTQIFQVMMSALGLARYGMETRFPIEGTESWHYVTVDSAARRVYVSHGTRVEVLNADTGKKIGFTSNGKEDKVSMFNTETLHLIAKIPVGKGPDGIYFDHASNRVFTNNHGSHDISAIDVATGKVVGTVGVEGDGEQAVSAGDGLIYVNLEDKSEVVGFDPKSLTVKKRYPLGVAKTPTGLAMDVEHNRLFIGCRSESMVVMDATNGKVIAQLPMGTRVDAAAFDPESHLIFFSNGDGSLNIFEEKPGDKYEDAGTLLTQASAKTLAFDSKTHRLYLPAAIVEDKQVRAGSFGLLVANPAR